jgi:hypothetical protein
LLYELAVTACTASCFEMHNSPDMKVLLKDYLGWVEADSVEGSAETAVRPERLPCRFCERKLNYSISLSGVRLHESHNK